MSQATTHADYSHDWWTPPEWGDWASETALVPMFDPCPRQWTGEDRCDVAWWLDVVPEGMAPAPAYVNHPGGRGEAQRWWTESVRYILSGADLIWCAFNVEQLRHMRPSPFALDGWLVLPRERIGYIWGGPDIEGKRKHGERCKSPSNWSVFWSTMRPAPTPVPCTIVRTGA